MKPGMRSSKDRLRHTLLFEISLLVIFVPLTVWLFDKPLTHMGGMSIAMSLIAMIGNYIYNLLFDHALILMGKPLYPRVLRLRLVHAVFFEITLLFISVPMVMWVMEFGFVKALAFDLAFMLVVPLYTVFYNWAYDSIFPPPGVRPEMV
jgi:uncharacterized membrane protein